MKLGEKTYYRVMVDQQKAGPGAGDDKPNVASRSALALGFAYIGAKIGTIGTIIDIDKAVGHSLTMGEKFKKVFDGSLWNIVKEQTQGKTFMEGTKTLFKTFKFSIYTTAVGMAAGAALGWMRGDRIAKPSDLVLHPIKSLKAALGPEAEKPKDETPTHSNFAASAAPPKASWAETISQPQQSAQAASERY